MSEEGGKSKGLSGREMWGCVGSVLAGFITGRFLLANTFINAVGPRLPFLQGQPSPTLEIASPSPESTEAPELPSPTSPSTQVPIVTPAPTSVFATQDRLPYEDDFSAASSGWQVGDYDYGSVGYRDGYYFVSATAEGRRMWGAANRSFGNVVVEVEATQFSGPSNNNNAYGLGCRVQANGDGYYLLISGDGFYSIQKRANGAFENLADWTASEAINQGNGTNQLRVVCDGSSLALYNNGHLLGHTTDPAYTQGDIVLEAVSYEPEPTEIHIDDLRAYAPETVLLEDDFSDPSTGWEVGEYEGGAAGYRDGYYFVSVTAQNKWMWGVAHRSFRDVMVEVETTQFAAPASNNNAYGVRCRAQTNNDAYHLLISGDGFYSIQKSVGGTYETLVNWTSSHFIRQGNATNKLRAVCDGSRLALYNNGQLLGETTDSTWAEGDVALAVISFEAEPSEIHFDNLMVLEPGP